MFCAAVIQKPQSEKPKFMPKLTVTVNNGYADHPTVHLYALHDFFSIRSHEAHISVVHRHGFRPNKASRFWCSESVCVSSANLQRESSSPGLVSACNFRTVDCGICATCLSTCTSKNRELIRVVQRQECSSVVLFLSFSSTNVNHWSCFTKANLFFVPTNLYTRLQSCKSGTHN